MEAHTRYDRFWRQLGGWAKAFFYLLLLVITISWTVYVAEILTVDVVRQFRQPDVSGWSESWRWPAQWSELGWALWRLLLGVGLLMVLMRLVLEWSGRILQLQVKSWRRRPQSGEREDDARGLVVFLSTPPPLRKEEHEDCLRRIGDGELTLEDIALGKGVPEQWNWQPLFSSLLLCCDDEKPLHLVVLTSAGERGSDPFYERLKRVVKKLAPQVRMHKVVVTDAWSPQEIVSGLEEALEYLASRHCRLKDRQVLIDITGGTAAMSAIGAIFALQEGRRIIYGGQQEGKAPVPVVFHPYISFLRDLGEMQM